MIKNRDSIKGVGLLAMLFVLILFVFSALIVMSVAPVFIDDYMIKRALTELAKVPDVEHMSKAKLADLLVRRFQVNSIRVPANLVEVQKIEGQQYLVFNYEQRVNVMGNVDAIMKFNDQAKIE